MSDFIREVDEDYRRERLLKAVSRFQIPLVILIVAIVVGAGVWRFWVDSKTAAAEKDNAKYLQAELLAKQGKSEEAVSAFQRIGASGPAGYAMLARMRAAELFATSDPVGATKAFDAVANDEAVPTSMRDVARLRGAMLQVDLVDWKTFEQRYGRFSVQDYGMRGSMRELLALSALKAGDQTAAGKYLDQIIIDGGAPGALRNRAEAFRALLSGGPATASEQQPGPATVTPLTPPAVTTPPVETPSVETPSVATPAPAATPAPSPSSPQAETPAPKP